MKTNKILVIGILALLIGGLVGYQIARSNYSTQIKGLEEGFTIVCDGLNEVTTATNQIAYLTGIYTPQMDCEEVIQNWRDKY